MSAISIACILLEIIRLQNSTKIQSDL